MASNRNSFARSSLNITPSSVANQQQQQHHQQYGQQPFYNTIHPISPQPPPVYQPPQPSWWNTGIAGITGGRRNSFMPEEIEEQYQPQQSIPTIQIDQSNGYGANQSPGSSPTQHQSYSRARNSSISAARNKLRIMAMLDDVRKKRELRERRKSDIMAYLDDLIVPDDPAMANAAAGVLKSHRRRFKIYQFLNHPSTGTPWSITYHVMVFVIVFVCLILTICATIQQAPLQEKAIKSVYMLEKVVVVWFNIEFCLGLWSCACKRRYRGLMGKVRYLTVPSRLIDFVILSFTTIVLIVNPSKTGHEVFVISAFRGFHRFFQVAQVLTLNRPLKPWKVLASVIYDQREQLFIIYYTEFIVLCVLAYVAFLVERDTNENFNSIADAMWWGIVTLSTVGYGDRVPVTWVGKIISTLFTILGVAIFALPAGIIGTGLALKIEEVERNNIKNRKKVAAALLIQRAYRSWKAHRTYELVSKFFRERPMPIYKQHDYLSMAQKFIALLQFLVALSKFQELLRPFDMKTIVQSYSEGQTEVLLRTKLVQQSVEELSRRIEITENRVSNMSMKIETKQNMIEKYINNIRYSIDKCHRQLLANHLLIELLRTNNQRFNANTTMTTGRKHTSSTTLNRSFQMSQQSIQPITMNMAKQQQQQAQPMSINNRSKLSKSIAMNAAAQAINAEVKTNLNKLSSAQSIRMNFNLNKTKNLDTITSASNTSIEDNNSDDDDDDENDYFPTLTTTTVQPSSSNANNQIQSLKHDPSFLQQQPYLPVSSTAIPTVHINPSLMPSTTISSKQMQQRRQNHQIFNNSQIPMNFLNQQNQPQQHHNQFRSRRMSL